MCSTIIFGNNEQKYLAENYDHRLDHGLIGVNVRGTTKENGRAAGEKVIRWTVKYGSITFNQFSLELPVSGMNEQGLAIALMWHYEGNFGNDERYVRLSALQWIQYQLDNYQSIEEVVSGLETVRPKQEGVPLHYTLLDAKGNSLLLEFINGEPQIYVNPEFPFMTNTSYQTCIDCASNDRNESFPENLSIARFVQLYRQYLFLRRDHKDGAIGFDLLQSVDQTPGHGKTQPWNVPRTDGVVTSWSIVFNPSEKSIHYKTLNNTSIKEIKLTDFDFSNDAPYLVANINERGEGDALEYFQPYSKELNRNIVRQTATAFAMPLPAQDQLVELVDNLYQNRTMSLGS